MICDFEKYDEKCVQYVRLLLDLNDSYSKYYQIIDNMKMDYLKTMFLEVSQIFANDNNIECKHFSEIIKRDIDILLEEYCKYFNLEGLIKKSYFDDAIRAYPYESFLLESSYEEAFEKINNINTVSKESKEKLINQFNDSIVLNKTKHLLTIFVYICTYYSNYHQFVDIERHSDIKYLDSSVLYDVYSQYIIDSASEDELEKYLEFE